MRIEVYYATLLILEVLLQVLADTSRAFSEATRASFKNVQEHISCLKKKINFGPFLESFLLREALF